MKRLSLLLSLFFTMHTLSAQEVIQCPLSFPNAIDFQNYWDLEAEIGNEEERILDWIPTGKELASADESFTVQTYQFDKDFDLKMMYEKFVSTLQENVENPELVHAKVHSKNRKAIYFEWWINPPDENAQHEWIKMMKNKEHQLAIVRFVTKKELPENEEFRWVECVADSKFALSDQDNFLDLVSKKEAL